MSGFAAAPLRRKRVPNKPAKKLTELELAEVSCVDVPANQGARHLMFKNLAQVQQKGDAEEREAALLTRLAGLQRDLAERDGQLAHLADRLARLTLEPDDEPEPAPAPAPAAKAADPAVDAIIAAAAQAAVAKASAELTALRDRTVAVAERMEADNAVSKMARGGAGPAEVAGAVALAKRGADMPHDYWTRAMRTLADQLAPDLPPASRLQKAMGSEEGRALLAASTGDRRLLRP